MFVAEIRHRAADDLSFLLPAGRTVKRSEIGDRMKDCKWEADLGPYGRLKASAVIGPLSTGLAGVEGLEPPTPGFGDRCSSH